MREPSFRTSRLIIAGGLAAALAGGVAGFLAGRSSAPPPALDVQGAAQPSVAAPPPPPPPEQPGVLRRADLLALADRAADAAAGGSGAGAAEQDENLAGRRFDLVIPFGCSGPAEADSKAAMRWRYDAPTQTLRVNVSATEWQPAEWRMEQGEAENRLVEGFWVPRPWSSAETCADPAPGVASLPSAAPAPDGAAPGAARETLAIVQMVDGTAEGARPRKPRTFDLVKRLAPEDIGTRGFRLRLVGRIASLPGGRPFRCHEPAGGEQRPVCMVGAAFDEVAIEAAGPAGVLATWSLGNARAEN